MNKAERIPPLWQGTFEHRFLVLGRDIDGNVCRNMFWNPFVEENRCNRFLKLETENLEGYAIRSLCVQCVFVVKYNTGILK